MHKQEQPVPQPVLKARPPTRFFGIVASHQIERKIQVRTPSCDDIVFTPDVLLGKGRGAGKVVSRIARDLIDFHGDCSDDSDKDNGDKYGSPARASKMKINSNSDPKKKSPTTDHFSKFDNFESARQELISPINEHKKHTLENSILFSSQNQIGLNSVAAATVLGSEKKQSLLFRKGTKNSCVAGKKTFLMTL